MATMPMQGRSATVVMRGMRRTLSTTTTTMGNPAYPAVNRPAPVSPAPVSSTIGGAGGLGSSTNSTSCRRYGAHTNKSRSLHGGGNRIFIDGSGIGSDSSMIAANNRWKAGTLVPKKSHSRRALSSPFATSTHVQPQPTLPSASLHRPTSVSSYRSFSDHARVGGMNDEYGVLTSEGHTYSHPSTYVLESGQALPRAELRYRTYGTLNEARDNVLVVCHALTGNASLHTWWGDLLGPGLAFDTSRYFVVCANILGSCYGSTGPASPVGSMGGEECGGDEEGEKEGSSASAGVDGDVRQGEVLYGVDFPDVSVRDTVRLQLHMLQDDLKVNSVKCAIGGSFGGMQAVEYAAQGGSIKSPFAVNDESGRAVPFVRSVIPISCGPAHTAWQIAMSEVQRQAIYADPKWNAGRPSMDDPPLAGLSVARQIGMVSYRTAVGYEEKFGRKLREEVEPPYGSRAPWEVKSYLEYQGYKFLSRFDPITYVKLTEQMDTHDVGRNRGGRKCALSSVRIPALVLGIDSDVLYPLHEQEELASLFPNGDLKVINSDAGHDGFLLEQEQVATNITDFLAAHD